jgi:hypothetical protein
MTPDILIVNDVPPGCVTFRVLRGDEVWFLRWLAEGATPPIEVVHVDERSISVQGGMEEGSDADYICAQLEMNGLVIGERQHESMRPIREFIGGRKSGYPLCCCLWFACVFSPFQEFVYWLCDMPAKPARGLREVALTLVQRSINWWWRGRRHPTGCTPCPFHRAFGQMRPAEDVNHIFEGGEDVHDLDDVPPDATTPLTTD